MRSEHKMSGNEVNAFTAWRHYYCYVQRAGVRKAVKRQSHKKDRLAARKAIRGLEYFN